MSIILIVGAALAAVVVVGALGFIGAGFNSLPIQ